MCKYPAGIYISHKYDRSIDHRGKSHIHYIVRFQVYFSRASCAFDHDDVIFSLKAPKSFHDIRDQCLFHAKIISRAVCSPDTSVHNQLTSDIAGRLEQNRVHTHVRKFPAGLRLGRLRPPHLETVRCYVTVEGHVLALKRSDPHAVLMKNTAKSGDQKALARAGHGPLYHYLPALSHIVSSAASPYTCAGKRRDSSISFSSRVLTATRYQPFARPG